MFRVSSSGIRNGNTWDRSVRCLGLRSRQDRESFHPETEETGGQGMNLAVLTVLIIGTTLAVQWASRL